MNLLYQNLTRSVDAGGVFSFYNRHFKVITSPDLPSIANKATQPDSHYYKYGHSLIKKVTFEDKDRDTPEFDAVKARAPTKLQSDILQAEIELFKKVDHKFSDPQYLPLPAEAELALIKLTE